MNRLSFLFLGVCFVMLSCQQAPNAPRPRAYPKIEFPVQDYVQYNVDACPFTFRYPAYGEIRDKDQSCWFDMFFPVFNARLHCSYVAVSGRDEYDDLIRDAFTIADKINERANYMESAQIKNAQGVSGVTLHWTGPAASPMHFFLTDSTAHFFKAALYFDAKVQPDSLAPIVAFIQKDIDQMISSFNWKK